MEKIWIVKQESCIDGEHLFAVDACATIESARQAMKKRIDTILDESLKYEGAREEIENGSDENFDWCLTDNNFHIHCLYDAYYEYIEIEEKEILA